MLVETFLCKDWVQSNKAEYSEDRNTSLVFEW